MNKILRVLSTIIAAVLLFGFFYFALSTITNLTGFSITGKIIEIFNKKGLDNFAECLSNKNVELYVKEGCLYCAAQKKQFGESVKLLNITDCAFEKDKCISEGILGFPTWKIFGKLYPGEKDLKEISELSGCEIKW